MRKTIAVAALAALAAAPTKAGDLSMEEICDKLKPLIEFRSARMLDPATSREQARRDHRYVLEWSSRCLRNALEEEK